MNDAHITPFVSSVAKVFDVAFQMNVQAEPMRDSALTPPHADVTATIELTGDFNATLQLGFPLPTAQRLVSLLTGVHAHEQTASDVADALGEIANMVAGNAKPHFARLDIRSACPVVGFDDEPVFASRREGSIVCCVSDCGEFTLRLIPPQPKPTITTRTLVEAAPR